MHEPPHIYLTQSRPGVQLPKFDRWACLQAQTKNGIPWCGVKHTAQRHADQHCAKLNDKMAPRESPYSAAPIYRTERYSDTDLNYRGWTEYMISSLLGLPDAQDRGDRYVYEDQLFDASRVHDIEITPAFDRLAAEAHNGGQGTTHEEDFSAVLYAVNQNLDLEIPSLNRQHLLDYAKADLQRMSDAKTARENGLHVKRNLRRIRTLNGGEYLECSDEYAIQHAADRCSTRSRTSNSFFRHYRHHHLSDVANTILDARLASAVRQLVPELHDYLTSTITNQNTGFDHLDHLPAPGQPLPWSPVERINRQGEEPLHQKLHNVTTLRWASYQLGLPEPPAMPAWGIVTITTADDSLEQPFTWSPMAENPALR